MAAITFKTVGRGRNPRDAFRAAQEAARAEHGSFGYTGTIAEKPDFWMRTPSAPELTAFVERARRQGGKDLGRDDIRRQALFAFVDSIIMTNETWVPCFCVELGAGEYLFFGRASC